jgi:hypothetical protein
MVEATEKESAFSAASKPAEAAEPPKEDGQMSATNTAGNKKPKKKSATGAATAAASGAASGDAASAAK